MATGSHLRGSVADLPSPSIVADSLPAMLASDDFVVRFTEALGAALAPVLSSLDNLEAYLDPRTTPEDFLPWLASWVGAELDHRWPEERRRAVVAGAAGFHRWRGTLDGLVRHLTLLTGEEPEIEEGGGVTWSASPGGPLPGSDLRSVVVRVRGTSEVDLPSLQAVVAAAIPAHLDHTVEVLGT